MREIVDSTDLNLLHVAIGGLIGRKCWKVAFTYGGELTLHFGRRLSYGTPQLADEKHGEWELDTRASSWVLFTPSGAVSDRDGEEANLEVKLRALQGREVTRINVGVPDNVLSVEFGGQHMFQIVPKKTRIAKKDDLSDWELFMPHHQMVTFGPGKTWSRRRSDVPMSGSAKPVKSLAR